MTERPDDHAARTRALDPMHSFIVQAPAGSGKTGLLTQRFLRLLATVRLPEEVLAITFTRKAAAEMRRRIVDALEDATGPAPDTPHALTTHRLAVAVLKRDRELEWQLVSNPNRLRVQTIDSLLAELARAFPVATELGAPPGILDDDATRNLAYQAAARQTLQHLDDRDDGDAIHCVLAHLDNDLDRTARLIADMLPRRDRWLRHVASGDDRRLGRAPLEDALAALAAERLATLADRLTPGLAAQIAEVTGYAGANLVADGNDDHPLAIWNDTPTTLGPTAEHLPLWQAATALLFKKDGELRKSVDVRSGFPAAARDDSAESKQYKKDMKARFKELHATLQAEPSLRDALRDLHNLPASRYSDPQWQLIEALLRTLLLAAAELQLVFAELGAIDFVEMQTRALRALGTPDRPTDLALAWDYRLSHILVDEFQDTSYGQFALLERLSGGWQDGDGRTLFLVGDPMQSIYRFREAEVGLYLQAWRRGLGDIRLERLTLTSNFRSQANIVGWLNEHCEKLFPASSDIASGAVTYSPATAAVPVVAEQGVALHATADDDRGSEAVLVVELVRQALSEPGTVAILVRSRTHIPAIASALRTAGIAYQGVDTDPLAARQTVLDLLALTRALADPADRVAWLALLRAPWAGLGLDDLLLLADRPDALLWQRLADAAVKGQLSDDGRQRVERLVAVLGEHIRERRRLPLHRAVRALWQALGGDRLGSAADADAYLELLARHERAGMIEDPATYTDALARLYAPVDSGTDSRVQIMTMHKAKGLEFDTVVLPGLGRSPRAGETPLLRWMERPSARGTQDLLLAPIKGSDGDHDPIQLGLKYLDDGQQEHESLRLLYVAMTRARRQLHLVTHLKFDPSSGRLRSPASRSLLAHLWPALAPDFDALEPFATEAPENTLTTPLLRRVATAWPPARRLPARSGTAAATGTDREPAVGPVEFDWAGESTRMVGIVVHRWLERIARDGLDAWPAKRLSQQRGAIGAALAQLGLCRDRLADATDQAQAALTSTIDDPRGVWLLGDREQAHVEWPLTLWEDGGARHLVIDRSFVDDGTRWIIDYKTSRHEGGGLDEFLDREVERYRTQLETYARALAALAPEPVRCALYFPVFGGWREWRPDIPTIKEPA